MLTSDVICAAVNSHGALVTNLLHNLRGPLYTIGSWHWISWRRIRFTKITGSASAEEQFLKASTGHVGHSGHITSGYPDSMTCQVRRMPQDDGEG